MNLISVIVPVYNVEKYIRKCIDSIINQTYTNLEIILVDDGSTDNSGKICDEYAEKDSSIKVIHQRNGGLSAARNAGVNVASGEYVSFIDSDDYVDNDFFEVLSNHLTDESIDIVVGNQVIEDLSGQIIDKKAPDNCIYSNIEALSQMCYERKFGTSACGSLVAKAIATMNSFPKGKKYEDLFTVYKWFANSKKTATTPLTCYHYVYRSGSISHGKWDDSATDLMDAADNLLEFISLNYPEIYNDAVFRYFFSAHDFAAKGLYYKGFLKIFSPYQKKLKNLWPELCKTQLCPKDKTKFLLLAFIPCLHQLVFRALYKMKF